MIWGVGAAALEQAASAIAATKASAAIRFMNASYPMAGRCSSCCGVTVSVKTAGGPSAKRRVRFPVGIEPTGAGDAQALPRPSDRQAIELATHPHVPRIAPQHPLQLLGSQSP